MFWLLIITCTLICVGHAEHSFYPKENSWYPVNTLWKYFQCALNTPVNYIADWLSVHKCSINFTGLLFRQWQKCYRWFFFFLPDLMIVYKDRCQSPPFSHSCVLEVIPHTAFSVYICVYVYEHTCPRTYAHVICTFNFQLIKRVNWR